ncbi:cbb3-type cytochrome oxidase subunit 3 [Candidatus Magnetaquicoccus inordinatus]|uniref:cbb3-type cytochrome oxidase subunit 3 n=1 Tax=Candidatus Magnetaquicoccus inordinatus TaxID=2496818 RepID=UPI00102C3051|nr:cbb3-type cytochrome c oxidase subunit 3 [Candidatus Magnetaquicoccus inordinatus]
MSFDEWLSLSRQFALVLFFLLFVGIIFWAYRPKNKEHFEKEGRAIVDDHDP